MTSQFLKTLRQRALSFLSLCVLAVLAAKAMPGSEVRAAFGSSLANPSESLLGNPLAPTEWRAELVNRPTVTGRGEVARRSELDVDSLLGRSGQLRARLISFNEVDYYPSLLERYGDEVREPGVRAIDASPDGTPFAFITLTPWRQKLGSQINGYQVGWWPAERQAMPPNYDNPVGFIEVTPENANTRVSTHFMLREFVTHDQRATWPKYVVLREDLLDKLELVLISLQSFGVATQNVVVLSGFRSPQYNARGVAEGMARASRHQFGDAADIIIDADHDGRMDDLNRDGQVDFQDTQVIDQAVNLVEQKHPDLVGGLGLYHETGPSGPFAHLDVRGTRARWTNSGTRSRPRYASAAWVSSSDQPSRPSRKCQAEGAMAILCTGVR